MKAKIISKNLIVLFLGIILFYLQACKKDDNNSNNEITLNFSSDSIVYQGQFYQNSITVDTNALVAIVKEGHIFLYYAGLGESYQDKLNDSVSAISLVRRVSYYYSSNYNSKKKSMNAVSIAGVEITDMGNQKYQFENTKRRMVGLKYSISQSDKVLIPPKGPLLDHNLITLLTDPNSADIWFDKSIYDRQISSNTKCEAFGSIFSIMLAPLALVQFQSILDAYNADPEYFTKVNLIDAVLVSFDIAEQILGQIPFCTDLVGYMVLEPLRLSFIAAIDNSSDPLVFQSAMMDLFYNVFKSTVECACTGSTFGLCILLQELENLVLLLPIVSDYGIRAWDVITTPAYGMTILGETNMVAYYPFNGNANDESGNGNNGTRYGATWTKDRFGNDNRAFSFNGGTDYISILDNNGLQFGTDDVTVCTWMKTSPNSQFGRIICRGECNGTSGWQITYEKSTNSILIGLQHGGGPTYFRGNKVVNDDKWHFVFQP